jgi:hypothetical protein
MAFELIIAQRTLACRLRQASKLRDGTRNSLSELRIRNVRETKASHLESRANDQVQYVTPAPNSPSIGELLDGTLRILCTIGDQATELRQQFLVQRVECMSNFLADSLGGVRTFNVRECDQHLQISNFATATSVQSHLLEFPTVRNVMSCNAEIALNAPRRPDIHRNSESDCLQHRGSERCETA